MFTRDIFTVIKMFICLYVFIYIKFVPTANKTDRKKSTTETKEYGRKLRLMWYFRDYGKSFVNVKFRLKFYFNPRINDVTIETYRSCLEERLMQFEIPSSRYRILIREEQMLCTTSKMTQIL